MVESYTVPGLRSFFGKVVLGWLGAWLGSPVLGHWFPGVRYDEVYFVPAILGSLAMLVLAVDVIKSVAGASAAAAAGKPEAPAM